MYTGRAVISSTQVIKANRGAETIGTQALLQRELSMLELTKNLDTGPSHVMQLAELHRGGVRAVHSSE